MATGLRDQKGWAYGLRDKLFGSQSQVIEPGKESELPLLQGEEYVQDLNKRNGGLTPGRSEQETLALKNLIDRVSSGDLDKQSLQVIAHRNPNARGYLMEAWEKRNKSQAVPNITSQYFNRPDLAPVSEINLGQPQAGGYQKTEVSPAQPQKDDPINAVRRLIQVGTPEALTAANQIASLYGVGNKEKSTSPYFGAPQFKQNSDGTYSAGYLNKETKEFDWKQLPKGFLPPQSNVTFTDDAGNVFTGTMPKAPGGTLKPTGKNVYDPQVADLADKIDKNNIARVIEPIKIIDKSIAQYGDNLPGVGNLKNVPVSSYLKTEEGQYIQAAVQTLFNLDLKQFSGVAVTEIEERRKRIETALTAANSAASYRKVYETMIRPSWGYIMKNVTAGVNPKAVDKYIEQGGLDVKSLSDQFTQPVKKEKENPQSKLLRLLREK